MYLFKEIMIMEKDFNNFDESESIWKIDGPIGRKDYWKFKMGSYYFHIDIPFNNII